MGFASWLRSSLDLRLAPQDQAMLISQSCLLIINLSRLIIITPTTQKVWSVRLKHIR